MNHTFTFTTTQAAMVHAAIAVSIDQFETVRKNTNSDLLDDFILEMKKIKNMFDNTVGQTL